jgi:hypothetical protein
MPNGEMTDFKVLIGEVLSVDDTALQRTAVVEVPGSGTLPPIALDNPLCQQYIPVPGQRVIVLGIHDQDFRIIAYLGSEALVTQGSKPIRQGESLIQGLGGGYLVIDNAGNVALSDRGQANVIQLRANNMIGMAGKSLFINVEGTGQIKITPKDADDPASEGKLELIKTNAAGVELGKVVITDGRIDVEGFQVNLGKNPITASVQTLSGVPGVYSYDPFGRPVPGSTTVKESL